jgi:tetratricopeptide (TPR) repeat protein
MAGSFVGRERELSELDGSLARALNGRAQVVFVAGEAGSGKSSLVEEFVRRAQDAHPDLIAAFGECNAQTGAGDPYLPFRQVLAVLTGADDRKATAGKVDATNATRLKEFVRISGETLLDVGPDLIGIFVPGASLLAKIATTAAKQGKLADKLAEHVKSGEPSAPVSSVDQERIFEQYAQVLTALSRQRPLILILDDLHWADSASLNLLFHLARQLDDSRVLIVGAYRPDDVALGRTSTASGRIERHPFEPILNEIRRYSGDVVIDLGAAQADEGWALVDALVDAEPNRLGAAFRQELYARTEGHPLFTVELLRTLQERGDLIREADGRWAQAASLDWEMLPARVEGVIAERLGRLTDESRETLTIGSVMGREFAAQVIAQVQGVPERELAKMLARELDKRHHLVQETGEVRIGRQFLSWYRFAHVLFQQYLYDDMSAGERRLLHGDVATVLETLYGDQAGEIAAQLAQHYQEAGEDEKALAYLIRAGDAAFQAYAQNEAAAYYSRALNLGRSGLATHDQLLHLYMRRGRAFELSEHYDRALANYQEMQTLGQARNDRSLELEALMLRALACAVGSGVRDLTKAQALALDALALASDLGDRPAESKIYWILLLVNRFGNEGARKAVEYGERSLALARDLGLKQQIALTLKDISTAYVASGRIFDANTTAPEALSLWREMDDKPMLAEVLMGVGASYHVSGKLDQAISASEESYSLSRSIRNRFGLAITACFISLAYCESGQSAMAIQRGEEGIALGDELGIHGGLFWVTLVELAGLFGLLGNFARAVDWIERATASPDPSGATNLEYPQAALASLYMRQGQRAAAEALLARSAPGSYDSYLEATSSVFVPLTVLSAHAELALAQGGPGRALALMDDVSESASRMGTLIQLPPALHVKARASWMLGRRDEAYAMLLDARARAETMQARYRLLPILMTLNEWEIALGHPSEAEAARRAAGDVVTYIADHAPVELRASFLNQPAVRAVISA